MVNMQILKPRPLRSSQPQGGLTLMPWLSFADVSFDHFVGQICHDMSVTPCNRRFFQNQRVVQGASASATGCAMDRPEEARFDGAAKRARHAPHGVVQGARRWQPAPQEGSLLQRS